MKLGLLTDIHEHVEHLKKALAILNRESVDQIVVLGDIFEMGERIEETCRLLTVANAIGVWGNHDFGLCHEPTDEARQRYHLPKKPTANVWRRFANGFRSSPSSFRDECS